MQSKRIQYLYDRHKSNLLTGFEKQEWKTILAEPAYEVLLKKVIGADWDSMELTNLESLSAEEVRLLSSEITQVYQHRSKRILKVYTGVAVAAAIILAFLLINPFHEQDIAPGGNRAKLVLADGRTVILSEDQSGLSMGDRITYLDGSSTVELADIISSVSDPSDQYATISTPKGGQYQLKLSDGTQVWLNAATTLRFPMDFKGKGDRQVSLTGEAYFEVEEDEKHPFKVISGKQTVEVLGTHFLVTAYSDESEIKTTLMQGSVQILAGSSSVKLIPDEQSILTDGEELYKRKTIANDEMAWVYGEFQFNDENLEKIMLKLARWYSVDVVFENEEVKSTQFYGVVSRFDHISNVLNKLEEIGDVGFKIEGNTVHVRNK